MAYLGVGSVCGRVAADGDCRPHALVHKVVLGVPSILGISSGVLAALALKNSGFKLWAVASVAAGLLIGQWWFVESMAVQILWSIRGFAP